MYNIRKNNDTILRKLVTDGETDGETDKSDVCMYVFFI